MSASRRPTELRLRSEYLYGSSLGSIALWILARTIGEDERGNDERRAIFVGLWPPMFWLIGNTVRGREHRATGPRGGVRTLLRQPRP